MRGKQEVSLRIEPNTLSLKSKGRWVTAHITTVDAIALDVDASSLLLNGVSVDWSVVVMNNTTLVAKVDRAAFAATVEPGERVAVTLEGRWKDGGTFKAADTIRVIRPGK